MKFLKYLLYLIGLLIVIAVILGLVGPKTFDVSRTAVVPGTPAQVWPYISSLQKSQLWSPWAEKDTNMVVEYTGTEGTVGSKSNWSGNKSVGKGSQTISVLEPNAFAESKLEFLEPWTSEATAYMRLRDTTGGTHVTWGLKGENGFVSRIFASLMSMDKMMAPDFERGLSKLTSLMASVTSGDMTALEVIPGDYPGGTYLGVRGSMAVTELEDFYARNLPAVFEALGKAGGTPAGMPCGLYYTWDEEKGTTDLAAAVAFTGNIKAPAGMEVITLPAAKSLTVNYYGPYDGLGKAHEVMDVYIQEKQLEPLSPAVEEYVTDPGAEPDPSKWLTKIVYFVK